MGKVLGLALALTLALSLAAAAEEAKGTVRWIDTANNSIVLEDGTRLWVSEGQMADLSLGDQVQAAYEVKGDRKVVTEFAHRGPGPDGTYDPLESMQSGDE